MRVLSRIGIMFLLFCLAWTTASATTEYCILRGAPGDDQFETRFDAWSMRLQSVLVDKFNVPEGQIHRYPQEESSPPLTRAAVGEVFSDLSDRMGEGSQLVLVLIGHGSGQGEARFMVEGPDITAADLRTWLDGLPTASQLVVNTTSASGAFLAPLSGAGRVICTSTQGGGEQNAPEFMEHLLRTLEEGRGDADRDGRLSWAEWVNAASTGTQTWYAHEGYISTEHALLDDDGDAVGARLPLEGGTDGQLSQSTFLGEGTVQLTSDYREAIAAVEEWKKQRDSVEATPYWDRLEQLLLDAARRYPPAESAP